MNKIIIFAIPEETTDNDVKEIIKSVLNITGGMSPITMLSENDLGIKKIQKTNQHIQYIEDIAAVIGNDSFNKIVPTQKFWENVTNQTDGFSKLNFNIFLKQYRNDEKLREYVQAKHLELVVKLFKQASEMM